MNSQGLPSEEWCFEQIKERELILCIHWEYARESPTIRAHVAQYGQLLKAFRERLRRERKTFNPRLSRTFLDNFSSYFPEHFKSEVVTAALETRRGRRVTQDWRIALPILAATFTGRIVLEPKHFPHTPWMALSPALRERIARRVQSSTKELIELRPWHDYSNTKFAKESRIIGKTERDPWEDVVVRIHWSKGTNEEIISDFGKWLTRYRRKVAKIPRPHRTRTAVPKAWLKRLAEMRLWKAAGNLQGAQRIIHAHTERVKKESALNRARPTDRQLTEPISQKADEDSVREDISRVTKDLRRLFGWVVRKKELPISYPFRQRRAAGG